ncbi:MAG TPA: hypothetical protein VES20_15870, partial [Bryobacteraceae bacterium]|nr:hypothetical protein [Bryobacteraceae bacterium]
LVIAFWPRSESRADAPNGSCRCQCLREFRVERVVTESLAPAQAVLSVDKFWDTVGQGPYAGAARERLRSNWVNGRWQITSKDDVEVYNVATEP